MDLKSIAKTAVADYRERTAPLVYRSVSDHALLTTLDALHELEHAIRDTYTVDAALTLRRQLAAIRARVDQLETLTLTRAAELGERG